MRAIAAYRGLLPDEMIDGWYGLERRQEIWTGMLGAPPSGSVTRIAVEPGAVLGLCTTFPPSRDDDADGETAEIAALYVHPARQGTGVGRALMGAALRA